jgi:hypothetical protein
MRDPFCCSRPRGLEPRGRVSGASTFTQSADHVCLRVVSLHAAMHANGFQLSRSTQVHPRATRQPVQAIQERFAYKPNERVQLGPLKVSPIGFGTWCWGAPPPPKTHTHPTQPSPASTHCLSLSAFSAVVSGSAEIINADLRKAPVTYIPAHEAWQAVGTACLGFE